MRRPASNAKREPRWPKLTRQAALVLVLAGTAVYGNSFTGPLVFDGQKLIRENPSLGRLWPWHYTIGQNRPVGFFTFALNYVWHGTDVWGYHAVNLAIHLAAGLVLFSLARRTLELPALADRYGRAATGLAFATALVWLVHPLQTQSVTYIYQRLESLMGLFYLLTLYAFLRAQKSPHPIAWYTLSVLCCALGMGTKEVMVTAPLVVLWYDRALVSSSWRELFSRRWIYYAALASTWAILAALMMASWPEYAAHGVLFVKGITPLGYALTQPGVIVHYLRLVFWPSGQCLDYAWPLATASNQVVFPALLLLALLAATLWAIWRRPAWGFVGGWFFMILAPTSSVAPTADMAFEHRMYLSLASVVVVVVIGVYEVTRRLVAPPRLPAVRLGLLTAAATLLGIATFERNRVYADEIEVWNNVIEVNSHNARAHMQLGVALSSAAHGRDDVRIKRAIEKFNDALRLAPHLAGAYLNRGAAYSVFGDYQASLADYDHAIALNSEMAEAYNNRAMLLASAPDSRWRDGKQAVRDATRACELGGWQVPAMLDSLAAGYAESGDFAQAVHWQQEAIRLAGADRAFISEARGRLELYRAGKPFRENR